MPPVDRVVAFALVALVFVAIPGPSVIFTVSRALTLGRRAALLTVLPQFVDLRSGPVTVQLLLLGLSLAFTGRKD